MNETKIVNMHKLKLLCNECESELTFKVVQVKEEHGSLPTHCPLCGNNYGMDSNNNPIVLAQRLLSSVAFSKGVTMSFICEAQDE